MDTYSMLSLRRSVRKYDQTPLDEATLREVMGFLNGLEQLPGQHAEFRLITPEEMGLAMAPHYVVASCEPADEAYTNVGYLLEALDLYLQCKGLGSLWYGMRLPAKAQKNDCIVMALGKTAVPLREPGAANRLPVSRIADADNNLTRAIRLAPSAVNSQPWFVKVRERSLNIRYHGHGLMQLALKKKLNKIDLGIALRFAAVAIDHEGKTVEKILFDRENGEYGVRVFFA